jgi:hypothetical protein
MPVHGAVREVSGRPGRGAGSTRLRVGPSSWLGSSVHVRDRRRKAPPKRGQGADTRYSWGLPTESVAEFEKLHKDLISELGKESGSTTDVLPAGILQSNGRWADLVGRQSQPGS